MMRHGRQFVILCSVVLVACGTGKKDNPGGATRWNSFPVQIYTDPALVTDKTLPDFQAAMSFWEDKVGKRLFDYRGSWDPNTRYNGGDSVGQNALYLQSPWNYASNIAAQTIVLSQEKQIQGAVIMVNPGTNFCTADCAGQGSKTSIKKVFAHELGHFIGLAHSTDTSNIMYPDALPGGDLSALTIDVGALRPLVQ